MLLVSIIVFAIAFGMGVVAGLLWGPSLLREKYAEMFAVYQKQLHDEVERTRKLQDQITKEYQQIIQKDLNNYLLATATPPSDKEELN